MDLDISAIRIDAIEVPANLYPRSKQPQDKDVQHLIGVDFPPITTAEIAVEPDDGIGPGPHIITVLVDGAHRLLATKLEGDTEIDHESLGLMTEAEVLATAIALNAKHGKQLSMADKAKLAKLLVPDHTIRQIVTLLSVGERTVSRWVQEAKEANKLKDWAKAKKLIDAGASVTAAAKDVDVPRSTLEGWTKNPPKPAERPKPAEPKANPADAECPDRVKALADMVIQDAKDIAKELDDTCWAEIVIAVTKKLTQRLPKEWKE